MLRGDEGPNDRSRDVPAQSRPVVYVSGEWEVDLARRELRAHSIPVPIGSRAFARMVRSIQSGKVI